MANLYEQSLLTTASFVDKEKGLTFITGYKYAESLLKTINGMTFFYDANWGSDVSSKRTFPLAFFHLKGIHEVMESEVQTKRMLFYNSQNEISVDSATGGIVNVVADNIVNKPKSYKLDVIVPYDSLTLLFNSTALSSYQIATIVDVMGEQKGGLKNATSATASFMSTTMPYVNIIKELINGLLPVGGFTGKDWLTSVLSTPSYNKNSLEAMWRNRTILKLKLWNGWDFKYVVITNIDITKESTEYGVEEATITCTELPIMTMRSKQAVNKRLNSNWLLTWKNAQRLGAKTKALIKTTGSLLGSAFKSGLDTTNKMDRTANIFEDGTWDNY